MTFTIIIRSTVIYFIVLFLLRLMGKRQIGEMQPYELVITLVIADLATVPMAETALPLVHGIIPLFTLMVLHYIISLLSRKSLYFRKLFNGKPIILINPDGIDFKALKKLNMNLNDLQESLRTCNYFNLEEVLYAILQTNGALVVVPRAQYAPLTAEDVGIDKQKASLPIMIIIKGKFVKENMTIAGLDESYVRDQLLSAGILDYKDVELATINNEGKMYIQKKNSPFISFQSSFSGGEW